MTVLTRGLAHTCEEPHEASRNCYTIMWKVGSLLPVPVGFFIELGPASQIKQLIRNHATILRVSLHAQHAALQVHPLYITLVRIAQRQYVRGAVGNDVAMHLVDVLSS